MNKISIERDSAEWQHLEYRLQLFLGLPAATPVTIFRFQNAFQELQQMQTHYMGKEMVDACIDTTNLDDVHFKKLFHRKTDMKSVIFQTGHLTLNTQNELLSKRYSILLARIVVGDSYCVPQAEQDLIDGVPEPYDSCYLVSDSEDTSLYRHNYILKNRSQYVIQYQMVYVLNREKEYNPRDTVCNKCQKRTAVAFCKQEEAYFCSQCNIVHHKDKLLSGHHRQPINKINSLGRCPSHNRQLTMFCLDCQRFLCIDCTLSGDHSVRQFAKHRVVMLQKYYAEKEGENGKQSTKKKEELSNQLSKVENLIRQVSEHAEDIYSRLVQKFEKCLADLKKLNKSKIDDLLAVKMAIKRQLDQCVWTESFIKYQQQVLKPQYYVEAQHQFDEYIKMILQPKAKPLKPIETNNIFIEGDIFVLQRNTRSRNGSVSRKTNRSQNQEPLDFYEKAQEEEKEKKSMPGKQVGSRLTELYANSQSKLYTKTNEKTPSSKESRTLKDERNVSDIMKQPSERQKSPSHSRLTTSKNAYTPEDSMEVVSQAPLNSRNRMKQGEVPSKMSAAQILKEKFGQLGLKNTYQS